MWNWLCEKSRFFSLSKCPTLSPSAILYWLTSWLLLDLFRARFTDKSITHKSNSVSKLCSCPSPVNNFMILVCLCCLYVYIFSHEFLCQFSDKCLCCPVQHVFLFQSTYISACGTVCTVSLCLVLVLHSVFVYLFFVFFFFWCVLLCNLAES